MNKNNGILFLALAAIGAGLYFMFAGRMKAAPRTATGTTGTNPYAPANSFAQLLGQRGGTIPIGNSSPGTGGGVGGGVDLSPLIKAGAGTLGGLAKAAWGKIFGAGQPSNSKQGTEDDGLGPWFDDYNRYDEDGYTGAVSEGGGFVGPVWEIPDSVEYASPGYGKEDWGNQQWESEPIDSGGSFDRAYGSTYDTEWI